MDDVAPELWERLIRLYESGQAASPKIKALLEQEVKTYESALTYSVATGKNAARALQTVLTEEAMPDGKMYFNIAERTVRPLLEKVHADVADYCEAAQIELNKSAGLGMKAIRPALNNDRLRGIIDRLTGAGKLEEIKWILGEPVVNFSQATIDESIRQNADFQSKAGIRPKLARTSPQCCDWCDKLVGVYDYPPADDRVWQRHDYCRCVLTYYPTSGASKGAWGNRVGGLTAYTEWRQKKEQQAERKK